MLNEINSLEKRLKTGISYKCSVKSHGPNCSVTKEIAFGRKISKKSVRRKLRRLAKITAREYQTRKLDCSLE